MNVVRLVDDLPEARRGVAVGTFDGVHLGHLRVIEAARAAGLRTAVVTFDPHPRAVLGWEVSREIQSRYGAVILRGALRRSMHAGVIARMPLAPLAQMLHGALTEACLVIAGAPDPKAAREEVGQVMMHVLEGLRTPA